MAYFLEKELIDEIIFKTTNPRNRIMLELIARGGMRVGEVLKIRHIDVLFAAGIILVPDEHIV